MKTVRQQRCVEWKGARNKRGYGSINPEAHGGHRLAHRWAWEKFNGAIPNGMHVLHSCDNPPCINPGHLFLGTHDDNMRDSREKGRQRLTHCKRGHELTEGNTYVGPKDRRCRICLRKQAAVQRQRRRDGSNNL